MRLKIGRKRMKVGKVGKSRKHWAKSRKIEEIRRIRRRKVGSRKVGRSMKFNLPMLEHSLQLFHGRIKGSLD